MYSYWTTASRITLNIYALYIYCTSAMCTCNCLAQQEYQWHVAMVSDYRTFPLLSGNLNLCGIERYSRVHSNKSPVSLSLTKPFPLSTFSISIWGWVKPLLPLSPGRTETKHRVEQMKRQEIRDQRSMENKHKGKLESLRRPGKPKSPAKFPSVYCSVLYLLLK